MLGKVKNFLIVCGMVALTIISLVGSVTSTLTWFTYISTNKVRFTGTTILSNKQLQVGVLVNPEDETDYEALGLTVETINKETGEIVEILEESNEESEETETTNLETIAWANPGGGLPNEVINAHLEANDYASTDLRPVTSRRFSTNQDEDITIYGSPYEYLPDNVKEANKDQYCFVSLCFRVINQSTHEYCKDKNVWIADAQVAGDEQAGFSAAEGVRVHFKSEESNFILNPSASEPGQTAVAGLLDLDNNGYYDTTYDRFSDTNTEILYGDYALIDDKPITYTHIDEDSDYDDINNTGKDSPYIFYSKHCGGADIIASYEDNLEIRYAQYESESSCKAEIDEITGQYTGGLPVCKTGNDYVGHVDMLIWIEGWDLAVVNQIWSLMFNLGITFEINKI